MRKLTLSPPNQPQQRPKPPVDQRVKVMDTLDTHMKDVLNREDLSVDERLKLHDQALFRYRQLHDDYRPSPSLPPPPPPAETDDLLEKEIMDSVPKTHRAKASLLLRKMKASPDITLNDRGELKYKGETVRGSNVVDLVNDVLRKRKHFNPQGWETFGDALREVNVSQNLIGHEDRWKYIRQPKTSPKRLPRTPRQPKRTTPSQEFFTPSGKSWSPY